MRRSSRLPSFLTLMALLLACPGLGAATGPSRVLVLGPLPLPPPVADVGAMSPALEPVTELDPGTLRVVRGTPVLAGATVGVLRWREVALQNGVLEVAGPGVHWVTVRLGLDRWSRVRVEVRVEDASARLWIDGEEGKPLPATVPLRRGMHDLVLRLELTGSDPLALRITADPDGEAAVHWETGGRVPLADLEATRAMRSFGPLAMAPDGSLVARRISWREPGADGRSHRMDLLGPGGGVVAAAVGGPSASPVAFLLGSGPPRLLFRRKGASGTDLVLFDTLTGRLRTVVRGEPGLAFVRISPDGRLLLVASARGVKKEKEDEKAPRRRRALREKLTDYVVRRQLFLVDLGSGLRRLLVPAGDRTLDDARFDAGQGVVYLRTLPMEERPWFTTQIRRVDLATGEDRLLAAFRGGWEGRPSTLAADREDGRIAFIGPPGEVGAGHAEHNVYNRSVWLVQRDTGRFRRIMGLEAPAATLGRSELLRWAPGGRKLLVGLTVGSRTRLGWLRPVEGGESWRLELVSAHADVIGPVALSADLDTAVWSGSSRHQPNTLWRAELSAGGEHAIDTPNAAAADWKLSRPVDWSFEGPGGETIDAWWYPPVTHVDSGKTPLIVYYYGGATPTLRGFSTTHQMLAGNGYAVLVLNPRGARGYGDAFADAHVNDWGPKASADILAGVEAFVASHPQVDGKRVGIYGGSYGGFMTEYLVSHSKRFAAAVAMYGISDIASYWGAGTWGYTYGDTALARSFPWNARELFSERSPLYTAGRIETPLLLLHGLADVNVPEGESEQLYTALRTLGRKVELVTFPKEDHGIAGSWKNWVGHRRMMLEFFDRILRGQSGAWNERWGRGADPAE